MKKMSIGKRSQMQLNIVLHFALYSLGGVTSRIKIFMFFFARGAIVRSPSKIVISFSHQLSCDETVPKLILLGRPILQFLSCTATSAERSNGSSKINLQKMTLDGNDANLVANCGRSRIRPMYSPVIDGCDHRVLGKLL